MIQRRPLLLTGLAGFLSWPEVQAQQRRSLADPLRLGADRALVDSGLASALQKAFGRDTGVAVKIVSGPSVALLEALERGELDATLTNAPDAELKLEKQGLAHDRQTIALGRLVIVGPAPKRKLRDPAEIAGGHDGAAALTRIRDTAIATPDALTFLSASDGSGTHLAEQALWRAAKLAPVTPWYQSGDDKSPLLHQARARNAYALVERGVWDAQGGAPLAVLVDGDPSLSTEVHVMRSFRVSHPAGKIFVNWILGPKGRHVVASHRGYRAP